MKRALFLTAVDRVAYLQETLYSWDEVRGLKDWHFVAMIEPSERTDQVREEFEWFVERNELTSYEIIVNPVRYGVLHHPWVGFERLLLSQNFDFVVRAEDDLVVANDVLEFFNFASEEFKDSKDVVTAHAYTYSRGPIEEVELSRVFSPWVWGTWRNHWRDTIGPTWDHDYSTYNIVPGHQSGWDWNLNTRIFPLKNLYSATPALSRANNIGVYGTHGNAENFDSLEDFSTTHPVHDWEVRY